jgi:uncharacterized protein
VSAAAPPAHRLIVFARLPRRGRVKSRLAAAIGPDRALEVYRALLERTLRIGEAAAVERRELQLAECDPSAAECRWLDTLRAAGWQPSWQQGADLGERMARALARAFEQRELPVLIGSDCPVLEAADLESAFAALERSDAVFCPTEDGGYALVGATRPLPDAFRGIAWGGGDVMAATRAALRRHRVGWTELRTVWDVDVEADLQRWLAAARRP